MFQNMKLLEWLTIDNKKKVLALNGQVHKLVVEKYSLEETWVLSQIVQETPCLHCPKSPPICILTFSCPAQLSMETAPPIFQARPGLLINSICWGP